MRQMFTFCIVFEQTRPRRIRSTRFSIALFSIKRLSSVDLRICFEPNILFRFSKEKCIFDVSMMSTFWIGFCFRSWNDAFQTDKSNKSCDSSGNNGRKDEKSISHSPVALLLLSFACCVSVIDTQCKATHYGKASKHSRDGEVKTLQFERRKLSNFRKLKNKFKQKNAGNKKSREKKWKHFNNFRQIENVLLIWRQRRIRKDWGKERENRKLAESNIQ